MFDGLSKDARDVAIAQYNGAIRDVYAPESNGKRPVAVVLKCQHDGFGFDLTAQLFVAELPRLIKKLRDAGVVPANSPYIWPQQPASNGAGDAQQQPICPVHGTQMRPSTKGTGYYCSKKLADGSYCKERAK